jgi:hypothetical protein
MYQVIIRHPDLPQDAENTMCHWFAGHTASQSPRCPQHPQKRRDHMGSPGYLVVPGLSPVVLFLGRTGAILPVKRVELFAQSPSRSDML